MKSVMISYDKHLHFADKSSLKISDYKWSNNNYMPVVEVYLCHNNDAIKVGFTSFETDIRCKEANEDGLVWCDSCVEFFIKPFENDERYINFEMNPAGAMIMSIGTNKYDRKSLIALYKNWLNVKTQILKDCWKAEFIIPFDIIREIYSNHIDSITYLKGNFYKCGDETPYPHFGMWNEIDTDEPFFHTPECFGNIYLQQP